MGSVFAVPRAVACVAVLAVLGAGAVPATAGAQTPPALPAGALAPAPSAQGCASGAANTAINIPKGLTGDELAVAQDAASKAHAALPAGATVVECIRGQQTLPVPAGVQVRPSPLHADANPVQGSGRVARAADNGGSGQLATIGCSLSGYVYYASTPTYLHVQVNWSCNAWYSRMSGAAVVLTPSSGSFVHPFNQGQMWYGASHEEFSGVAWYGYHNRAVYEYAYFAFSVGTLPVSTNEVFI